MHVAAGRPAVDQLDRADLDDAMPLPGSRPVVSVSSIELAHVGDQRLIAS